MVETFCFSLDGGAGKALSETFESSCMENSIAWHMQRLLTL